MKKTTLLLLFCWLLALGRVAAQSFPLSTPLSSPPSTPPSDSVRLYLDNMFANLDKTQVPTPYLEEYGFRFAPLRLFAGTLQDSNRTTATLWRLLYGTVLSGNINGPCALPMLPDLNTALRTQTTASPAIPLLVQRLDYATLRPDAVSAGLLTGQNEQLFDVPGRPQSPYQVRTLFAAAPARSTVPTGDVSFVFTQALHVQSGGGGLRSLSLDFGDGRGYLATAWNQPLAASYSTAGTKRVKVRVTYTIPLVVSSSSTKAGGAVTQAAPAPNNPYATYESHFDLEVLAPATNGGAARYANDGFTYSIPPRPGLHSGALVSVRLGGALNARTQITKPLIVAEGYDPSSIAPEVQSNIEIRDFLADIATNSFSTGTNLFNALQDQFGQNGYDIIYIDYNNGTDDIRRNAALFEEVVRWVNNQKVVDPAIGAKQRNVVLGISMGGLVARYGLAEMEKRGNDPTDTRLLLTHDSPHRGANTPLGIQALTRQAAGSLAGQTIRIYNNGIPRFFPKLALFPVLQQADDLLDAPATRQLLLVRATRQFVGAFSQFGHEYNSFVDGEYRTMITPSPGQPFPYEFKATSLGSQCASGLFAPHSELVRIEGEGYITTFLASTGLHTEIIVNALPNGGQVERLSSLRVWQEVRVLFFRTKIYLTRFDYHSPASNPVAWDGLPGGTQRINGQIDLTPGTGFGWQFAFAVFGYNYNLQLVNSFCFVPTASALDVPVIDNITTRSRYINDLTSGPSRPLASKFIAQGQYNDPETGQTSFNFEHPRFPGRQAQWLFNEMQQPFTGAANTAGCIAECATPLAIASTLPPGQRLCQNTSVTFSLPNLPAGAVVTWSTVPAGNFTVATGAGPTFTTAASSSASGNSTVTATVGACQTPVSLTVPVGGGEPTGTFSALGVGSLPLQTVQFVTPGYTYNMTMNEPYDFTFTSSSPSIPVTKQGSRFASFYLGASSGLSINVVSTNAPCGRLSGTFVFSTFGRRFVSGPNPVSDELTITRLGEPYSTLGRSSSGVTAASSEPFDVELFDGFGRQVKAQRSTGGKALLDVRALPNGLYILRTGRGKETIREHIQITH
ncbi:T9SS type A sorting domain-containing protein [Hymenobacter sp.]|uniref:T9SS type A sorting domain-containing protein n=1 Tax=Hymenobacter sp. TaxID=1898978 RepID=UPI00286CAF3F|nr:T9SS type A sorting domain-containing protein [Hymenobacter sp.]